MEEPDIEQLLAMSDSDGDEVDMDAVDLEQLLQADEDEDDEIHRSNTRSTMNLIQAPTISLPPKVLTSNIPIASTSIQAKIIKPELTPILHSTPTSRTESPAVATGISKNPTRPIDTEFISTPNSFTTTPLSTTSTGKPKAKRGIDALTSVDALEIAESRERRFLEAGNREIISALQVKLSKLREVDSAVGMTRVRATRLTTISSQLSRNAQLKNHGPGIATCICVHPKFIAVGTSRGLVLLFDHFQEPRQAIGQTNATPPVGVTSVCVSTTADMLLAGYSDGKLILWDVLKGTALRTSTDVHSHPIRAIRCLPSIGAAANSEFTAISADAKGVMYRLRFSRSLLSGYVLDSECLLDGAAGEVLCMEPLPKPGADTVFANLAAQALSTPQTHAVAFSSNQRTFLVQVYPTVSVLHRWNPPTDLAPLEEGEQPKVSVAWQWVYAQSMSGATAPSQTVALLRAWENMLELLTLTTDPSAADDKASFRVSRTLEVASPILATKWLGHEKAVVLTQREVLFVRTDTLVALEHIQLDSAQLSPLSLRGISELVSMCDDKFYLLFQEEAYLFGLQSWSERVDDLIRDGQWLEALALVLEQQRGVEVSGYSQPSASRKSQEISERADSYLLKYVNLSIDNAPRTPRSPVKSLTSFGSRSHFHMVAGVCIEYCVEAMRTDLLFGAVYAKFKEHNQTVAFLESLEPYILSTKIESVSPIVLGDLVTMFQEKQDLAGLERCLVHLNPREMDLHTLLLFTASSGMTLAILYIYSQGLRDYAGAFQVVAESIFLDMPPPIQLSSFSEVHKVAKVGSERLLLFVYDTFTGRTFPRGLSSNVAKDGARGLLELLMTKRYKASSNPFWKRDAEDQKRADEQLTSLNSIQFPYLMLLAGIDVRGFFRCVKAAITNGYAIQSSRATDGDESPTRADDAEGESEAHSVGSLLSALYKFCKYSDRGLTDVKLQMLTSLQSEIVACDEQVTKQLIKDLLETMTSRPDAEKDPHIQDQVGQLARKHMDIFDQEARNMLESRGFWRAVLILLRGRTHFESDFKQAIRCYLNDPDGSFQQQVFGFIDESLSFFGARNSVESSQQASSASQAPGKSTKQDDSNPSSRRENREQEFKQVIVDMIVDLANVDVNGTKALVVNHLGHLYKKLIEKTTQHSKIQFQILDVLVKGHHWKPPRPDDGHADSATAAVSQTQATADAEAAAAVDGSAREPIQLDAQSQLLYVALLANYQPSHVFDYLSTHEPLALGEILQLCRQKEVVDATALLLERSGDVQGALSTLLHEITSRLQELKKAITSFMESNGIEALALHAAASRASVRGPPVADPLTNLPEWKKVTRAIDYAIRLCQRNATENKERAELLWFDVLDTLLIERNTLKGKGRVSEAMAVAIGRLVKQLLEPMSRSVAPQEIVKRITDGVVASGSRLAEFKEVMFSMLDAYTYEMFVLRTVNKLIAADTHQGHIQKLNMKRGAVRVTTVNDRWLPLEGKVGNSKPKDDEAQETCFTVQANGSTATAFPRTAEPTTEELKGEMLSPRRHRAKYGRTTDHSVFHTINQNTKPILDLSPALVPNFIEMERRRPGSLPVSARFLRSYSGSELS